MPKVERLRLERVHYMPKTLEPGVLYASDEFSTAAHLCACGCGVKIRTPLGPAEWRIQETKSGPSLSPSVGNWQQPCHSHYWIWQGEVEWHGSWTEKQIKKGRQREEQRRKAYFAARENQRSSSTNTSGKRIWDKIKNLVGRG